MPPEGPRIKTEENWDLVNYVRSLAKKTSSRPEAAVKRLVESCHPERSGGFATANPRRSRRIPYIAESAP